MDQQTAESDDETSIVEVGIVRTRKPYLRPKLVRLGSLADITRTVGRYGADDGRPGRGRSRTAN